MVAQTDEVPVRMASIDGASERAAATRPTTISRLGQVAQVNTSPGGVPKLPVGRAWVGTLGLEGDGHNEPLSSHGGPDRAVCIFSLEKIAMLRAEGHPIGPGTIGENVDLEGIDIGALEPGDQLEIGDDGLRLEITTRVVPCKTIAGSFLDGRFVRLSPRLHERDTRLYARVLVDGPIAPGDVVIVRPAASDPA